MNYLEIIMIIVSFLAIAISLFTIWIAMMFYRLYTQLSLLFTEMSKGLEMSTVRLEKMSTLLYHEKVSLSQIEKENPKEEVTH